MPKFYKRAKMEEPLNIDQAARFLGLKKGTVYNMVSRKVLPHYKIGRRVFFRQTELEAWFKSKFIPCVSWPRGAGKKPRRTNVDVQEIVRNAVEQFTLT
jgi:excisionase family DNA binding protein